MSETRRARRSAVEAAHASTSSSTESATDSSRAHAQPAAAPAWAGPVASAAPFTLAGVQRKVAIGAPDDAYEREAEYVASRVASGQPVAADRITPIGGAGPASRAAQPEAPKKEEKPKPSSPAQKAAAPEEKKKDEKPNPPTAQKAAASEQKKKDERPKPAPPAQRAAADEKKKDEKPKPAAPAQRAPADEKKKDEKAKPGLPAQKAAADEKKKEEKPKTPPVQKAPAPEKKKEDEKPKLPTPAQKTPAPDPKKEEKPKPAAAQRAAAEEKKKEPPKSPAAQRAEKRREKKEGETLEDKLKDAPVQKAAAPEEKKKDEKKPAPVQKASGDAAPATPAMESTASQAIGTKGAGEPLHAPTRDALESRMGTDLSGVRVHQDSAARQAADAIDARAFTHGSDVWLGSGESQSDVGLMAHEATHVVQQAGGAHRLPLQRATKGDKKDDKDDKGAAAEGGEWEFESPKGKIDTKNKKISIPKLQVPTFKKEFTPSPLKLPPKEEMGERDTKQIEVWEKAATESKAIESEIDEKCKSEQGAVAQKNGEPIYFLELPGESFYIIGTKKEIKQRTLRPFWDKGGKKNPYQVDHKQEYQLTQSGEDPDRLENFWLLDAEQNQASGRNIKGERDERLEALLAVATKAEKGKKGAKGAKEKDDEPKPSDKDAAAAKTKPVFDKPQDPKQIRNSYEITFEKVEGGLEPKGKAKTWTIEEIRDKAAQLKAPKLLTEKEIKKRGLQGTPDKLAIYNNAAGGSHRVIEDWNESGKKKATFSYGKGGKRALQIDSVEFNPTTKEGMLHGKGWEKNAILDKADLDLPISPMDAIAFGGFVPPNKVAEELNAKLHVKGMSPVEIYQAELTEAGIYARGRVLPTVPLIKDIGIDLVIEGPDVYLSKVFSADELKLPGPIKFTAASLEIYAGTNGVGAKGQAWFEVERAGRGRLYAKGAMGKGFAIGGEFDFDSELFDPAHIEMEYAYVDGSSTFSGAGEIGIKPGKVKGIKSASLKVSFVNDKIDAVGTVKPDIPAVEQGDMEFHYAPDTGILIAGKLTMKKDTPGIESGWVAAELAKRPGEDRWRVKAAGEAVPKIPGISSKVLATYDDGLFDIVGTVGYEKGMLKGSITLGVTNRPVNPEGTPGGEPPAKADKVTLYGGGSLTLRLAPWLQASATVRLLPNGEIEVTGQIGLPAALELFKGKEFSKNIFTIGIDIPIIGLSAAGHHVGIYASIKGGVDVSAGIGPGELQELSLAVTYNPAHEDETHVTGGAKLHIPAHAGVRLFIRGALGAGIPIVDAEAGIEVGGTLGIEGALDAAVQVDWTPTKGLDVQAMAEVYAEPKFKFDITGYVLVELDLWVDTIELYSKKWKLAEVEYGSGLRFGLKLPIHYIEGQPFDVSLSDIQFQVPDIDAMSLLSGLVDKIL